LVRLVTTKTATLLKWCVLWSFDVVNLSCKASKLGNLKCAVNMSLAWNSSKAWGVAKEDMKGRRSVN